MISTLTETGAPARNAVPSTTGPSTTGPSTTGPSTTGPSTTGPSTTGPAELPLPLPSQLPASVLNLLRSARRGLAEAESERDPATRYVIAHLAALRAAAAIVAARGEPGGTGRRRRPRPVWDLLSQVEPALAEWAAFFAASAAKRAAAEAGLPRAASAPEADDLLRDVRTFLAVADRALGLEGESMLPLSLRRAS